MRVLVLGNSDAAGERVAGPTWPVLLGETLARRGADAEVMQRWFTPLGGRGPTFAGELVQEMRPDVVVLPLNTYAFTVGLVHRRVGSLLGVRVGRLYRRAEQWFDGATRSRGVVGASANRATRAAARSVVGTVPMASVETVTAVYRSVFEVLSRAETVQVVVFTYPPEQKGRDVRRLRAGFFGELQPLARRLHYAWLDGERELARRPGAPGVVHTDGFHLSPEGHRLLGEALAHRILDEAGGRAAPATRATGPTEGTPSRG